MREETDRRLRDLRQRLRIKTYSRAEIREAADAVVASLWEEVSSARTDHEEPSNDRCDHQKRAMCWMLRQRGLTFKEVAEVVGGTASRAQQLSKYYEATIDRRHRQLVAQAEKRHLPRPAYLARLYDSGALR